MWYYLVVVFVLTANGQQAFIRSVGSFQTKPLCEEARRNENPALWVGDECFEDFEETRTEPAPAWFRRIP